ncbi:hypothetical protein Tsubulata_023925 [Turnera subulata]|uniref:Peptidase A1 domain-containing protein n=1 Tax=Turnera subulata TaxID=218843 RepID=A0A9Q0GJ41_9ROSI|nr:hypothetical protein Tsubulata_023925 [Turnera subulata]
MLTICSSTFPMLNNTLGTEKFRIFHKHEISENYNVSLEAQLERDKRRVEILAGAIVNDPNNPLSTDILHGEYLGSLEYLVRVGVGSPPLYQHLVVDTGSDLTWVQCQTCSRCYSLILCDRIKCDLLGEEHNCKDQQYIYDMGYADGSTTQGTIGLETFAFENNKVLGIAFGCGHKNQGSYLGLAGVLGLGRGNLSIIGQLGEKAGLFRYCLVRPGSKVPGWLQIGVEAMPTGAVWAPTLHNPQTNPSFYYVGDIKVPIPEHIFQLSGKGQGGADRCSILNREAL